MADIRHHFIDTNGIRMHVAAAGSGPLVVLCHGFPESWYSWRHQLVALADAGFHAVAPDQRGYGQTTAPPAIEAYSQLHLVGDLVGLVSALGERTAVVVGHDWGAPVAWNAGLWRPDVFRTVAALSVPTADRGPLAPTTAMRQAYGNNFFYILYFQQPGVAEHELYHDVRRTLRQLLVGASGNAERRADAAGGPRNRRAGFLDQFADPVALPAWLTPADLDYFTAEFERTGFRGPLNWYRNIDRNWEHAAAFQGRTLEQPALFISGDRDLIRGNPGFEARLRAVVPNLREVVILPGIGHWTQQEAPAATNAALIGFLRALP